MPVDFLTASQRQRYGSYPSSLSADELGRHFHLDDDDRQWVSTKRRAGSRLGFALQLVTVRFLGTFLEDPVAVPSGVVQTVAAQIDVADLACATTYQQSEQRWRHTAEIRAPAAATGSLWIVAFSFGWGGGFALCAGPERIGPACCSTTPVVG